jgi:hypothetical protein
LCIPSIYNERNYPDRQQQQQQQQQQQTIIPGLLILVTC